MSNRLDDVANLRAIQVLAKESKVPFDDVARLYERERVKLELGAKVKQYLPIFIFRNVQAHLLERRLSFEAAPL
jgi:hypothetical protein